MLRCEHVLSHDSAAIALGLGSPDPVHALVHVTRTKVHGDAVRAGVKHHLAPFTRDQVVVVDGMRPSGGPPTTSLAQAWETTPSGGARNRTVSDCGLSGVGLCAGVTSRT